MNFFKKLFGSKKKKEMITGRDFLHEQYDQYYELKKKGLEETIGEMANMLVMLSFLLR